jgi:CheY-like chemotaxis protein
VAGPLEGVKVLLVEDDDDTRHVVSLALADHGAAVRAVAGVQAAFDALAAEPPDVIVSDLAMPAVDGHTFLHRLRRQPRRRGGRIPAVALTALDSREARLASRQAGYHYHLTKPVDTAKLVEIVAGLVRITRR